MRYERKEVSVLLTRTPDGWVGQLLVDHVIVPLTEFAQFSVLVACPDWFLLEMSTDCMAKCDAAHEIIERLSVSDLSESAQGK